MRRKAWPKEHYDYLREIASGRYNDEITELMNKKFETEYTEEQIRNAKARKRIRSNVPRRRPDPDAGLFTREQKEFVKNNVKGRTNQELADLINETFGLSVTAEQMNSYKANHGLRSGLDFRFKKGHVPANKGKKYPGQVNHTSFKKGHKPINYRPVGSERVNVDGYVEVKVADPNVWRLKQHVVWEQEYGPIPDGHCLIFLDGNKQNTSLDNLQLISRNQLARMNQMGLIQEDAELTKIGLIIADIHCKIGERKRKHGQKSQ